MPYLPNPEFGFVFIVGILIVAIFAASFQKTRAINKKSPYGWATH
jgi:hypothetical protein